MSLKLADDQRFALMKLRRNVKDVLQPHHNDEFLVRWLKARKWDPAAAEKMLKESLEWRKRYDIDNLGKWEMPEFLKNYLPHGVSGFDKEGAPVIIVPFAGLDLYGILHVVSRRDMIKGTLQVLENYIKLCQEQKEKFGTNAGQCTVIFDMEQFNLKQYMWRPAGELVIALIQIYEANYPEILKICYIVNAPKVFSVAFSIAKKFMNDYTISKIQIFKTDPRKWKPALLQIIAEDQFPAHYGGTLKDNDGNPKLTSKICQGGKVPKHLYVKKNDKENKASEFIPATIKKGDKLVLDFHPQVGSIISWELKTEDNDINFGVVMKNKDGSKNEIVPSQKISAGKKDEMGLVNCELPATYSIIFDNDSLTKNKKISYAVRVLPPGELEDSLSKA